MWCVTLFAVVICAFQLKLLHKLWSDEVFRNDYVQNSPRMFVWRSAFGPARAAEVTRQLVPVGVVLTLGMWVGLVWYTSEQ